MGVVFASLTTITALSTVTTVLDPWTVKVETSLPVALATAAKTDVVAVLSPSKVAIILIISACFFLASAGVKVTWYSRSTPAANRERRRLVSAHLIIVNCSSVTPRTLAIALAIAFLLSSVHTSAAVTPVMVNVWVKTTTSSSFGAADGVVGSGSGFGATFLTATTVNAAPLVGHVIAHEVYPVAAV